jgi:hypothetical protein
MARSSSVALSTAITLAGVAWAGEIPPLAPIRDVTIEYVFSPGAGDDEARVKMNFRIAAGGGRVRIDQPGGQGFVVIDRDASRMLIVLTAERGFFQLPLDPSRPFGFALTSQMSFAQQGTDLVAGIACTQWRVTDARRAGTACISDDGILLRAEGVSSKGRPRFALRAASVSYGRHPDSIFQPPAGYRPLVEGVGGR